jgi:hypothetical protein
MMKLRLFHSAPLILIASLAFTPIVEGYAQRTGSDAAAVEKPTEQIADPITKKTKVVDPFITTKAQLRGGNNSTIRAIHQAAKIGDDLSIVQYGVEQDRSILHHHSNDGTLLHESAQSGHVGIVKYLYEAGADVNMKSRDGATPMHLAVAEKNYEVVSYLESGSGLVRRIVILYDVPVHGSRFIRIRVHSSQ